MLCGFQVRVWQIGHQTQKLEEALKEHKSSVSCIRVKKNNEECVTASTDGTCIIWDLVWVPAVGGRSCPDLSSSSI